MTILIYLFLGSLLLGQITGISPVPGVVIYIHDIILSLLIIAAFFKQKIIHPRLALAIALFVLAGLVSLVANSGQFTPQILGFSGLYLVRWILYAALYPIVLMNFVSPRLWKRGLYTVGIAFGTLGLVQFYLYPDLRNLSYLGWDPHFYRLFSTLLDPNFAGIVFVLTLILGFDLWKEVRNKWLVTGGQIITLLSLLLTYSRSSYLAFIAALFAFVIGKKQWKILLGVVVFVLLIIFIPRTSGSTLSLLRQDSTFARIGNWEESLRLIEKTPLFGHGFDTLRYLQPAAAQSSKAASGLDSSVLFVAATTGIAGLATFVWLIISMIKMGRKSLMFLASLLAVGVHSLFVNSAFYPWVLVWIWILTGVTEVSADK